MPVGLSVVIVSYNTENLLRDCLGSVFAQQGRGGTEFEVIVVDNASTDGTRTMLRDEYPAARALLLDRNVRWAGGNNRGAEIASGNLLLFLNSDTVLREGALAGFTDFFNSHPNAAIAGCRLLNPDGTLQRSCRSFPGVFNMLSEASFLYLLFPRSRLFGEYHMTNFGHDAEREVDMVTGAAIAVRAGVFGELGGFDENFRFYAEETDFCRRAREAGCRTWFFPRSEILHRGQGSPQPRKEYFENLYRGLRRYLVKHHSGVELIAMVSLQWIGTAVRVPVYAALGMLTGNASLLRKSLYYLRLLF